jgi:hypothetical protein
MSPAATARHGGSGSLLEFLARDPGFGRARRWAGCGECAGSWRVWLSWRCLGAGQFRNGDFGRVEVVPAPNPFEDAGRWVQILQFQEKAPRTRYRGTFARFFGDGLYLATFILFIPDGMSAFVSFEELSGLPDPPSLEIEFPRDGLMCQPPPAGPSGADSHTIGDSAWR